ncbi:hypothetical protein A9R01_03320, partial ['Osedax' symbiont bacterium Rs2_46_30_T18]
DKPTVKIVATEPVAEEGVPGSVVEFTVSQDNVSNFDTTVLFKLIQNQLEPEDIESISITDGDGTVTSITDPGEIITFIASGITLTIPANGLAKPVVTITPLDDNLAENTEHFSAQISNPDKAKLGVSSASARFEDDDVVPYDLTATSVSVTDEALAGGIMDDQGNPVDNASSATASGTLQFVDTDAANQTFSVHLLEPGAALMSAGQSVQWQGVGSDALTGYILQDSNDPGSAHIDVITIDVGSINTISHSASYQVTLLQPIQHASGQQENIFDLGVEFQVSDGTNISVNNGSFTVSIEDDQPVAHDSMQAQPAPDVDTNLLFMIDVSGSMGWASGVGTKSRLELAKESICKLIDNYDDFGNVKVRVVTFSSTAGKQADVWVDIATAKAYINGLNAGGGTNYDAALAVAQDAFDDGGSIGGAQNISYFISDGEPTVSDGDVTKLQNSSSGGNSDDGIQSQEEIIWEAFLEGNDINSIALGMGPGVSGTQLDPIAYNGALPPGADPEANGIIVTDLNQLQAVLDSTVVAPVTGNILASSPISAFGADGGHVQSVTLETQVGSGSQSVTFSYDKANDQITNNSTGGDALPITNGSILSVITAEHGVLMLNMLDGSYSYQLADLNGYVEESIDFSLIDTDGDGASATVVLKVGTPNEAPVISQIEPLAVSEEGLAGGKIDDVGNPIDTTNSTTEDGIITITDLDSDVFSVVLSGPAGVSSGGESVVWSWDSSGQILTGETGSGVTVATISLGAQTDTGPEHKIAYTVELLAPIDHPSGSLENIKSMNFSVDVTDQRGASAATATMPVNVEDDMPVVIDTTQQFAGPTVDTNLMVILDLSGSMNSRLALAKEAIDNLIDSYDDLGDVKVHVVTFSDEAETNPGGLWLSVSAAKSYIDALSTGGGTNYDAALAVAMEAFDAGNNSISGAQNISYFLSDGMPTRSDGNTGELENNDGGGNSDDGIQIAEEALWIDFLKLNNINSFALGIGSGVTADELNPIAYNALNNIDDNTPAILVANINDLDGVLNNTVVPFVVGNIFSDPNNNIETGFGADGGYVFNVTLDVLVSGVSTSVTFTYDIAGDKITNTSGVLSEILGSAILKVATEEGEFILNMESGEYQYQLAAFNGHVDDLISYRLIDNDLDYADGAMTLIIGKPIGIEGAHIDVDTYVYKDGEVDKNVHTHAYDEETGYNNVVDAFDYIGKSDKNGESKHAEIDDVISSDYFMLIVLNGHRNAGSNILIETKNNGVQATDAYIYGSDGPTGVKGFDNQVYTLVDGNDTGGVQLLEGLQISFDANAILIPDVNGNFPIPDNNGDYLDSELSYGIRMTETGNVKNGLHGEESPAEEHRDGALTIMAVKVIKDANGNFIDPTIDYGGLPSPQSPSVDPYIIGLDEDQLLWETTVFAHTSGDDPRSDQEYIDNEALLTAINTGMFVDGIVEGLAYATSSGFSGFTDASGGFKYADGDLISFRVGNVVIGTVSSAAMADGTLFLQEIAGVGLENMNNDYVENMAVLLQSLDNDADAYNGIVIEQSVHQALSDDSFDMETISKADLQALLVDNGYQPVDEDAAMQHVRDMIELETGRTEFDDRISAADSADNEGVGTGDASEGIQNLIGEEGSDILFGGSGSDTFEFSTDDIGSSVETDTIIDFNSAEGDKIDLADLLNGEYMDNLDQYLSFEKSGGDTLIHVKSDGSGAADHIIKLADVDLFTKVGGGDYSQSEILDNLKGDLIIDH